MTTGKKLLASTSGIAFINKTRDEVIFEFQDSDEFETIMAHRVTPIYEDIIHSCQVLRRALCEKGQVTKEDISFLISDMGAA
ncbi:UNVERIFIED_CONTAM: hypothetical protein Sradi_5114600 [Sesamum radiatum]|uniref:Uncharacterized protein n=1 Tax=Sesamum radiatum TaxID=300843 RepID=A0AAW2M2V4_SESRA